MEKVSRSEYSKAYYNNRKRKGVNVTSEALTPELAKFIINKGNPKDFFELFGNNMNYLVTTANMTYKQRKVIFLVVRTKLGEVIGYSRFDSTNNRVLKGDRLNEREFTAEQIQRFIDNNVNIEVLNPKGSLE